MRKSPSVLVLLAAAWLAAAVSAQQIGPNDFPISDTGPAGDPLFDAAHDAVTYNPDDDEYLVVWDANDTVAGTGLAFDGKRELYARRLSGDGAFLSPLDAMIATAGPAGDARWDTTNPEVVYNPARREYLVVFERTLAASAAAAKTEIFGLRLTATAAPIGAPFRVSTTGPDSNLRRDAVEPGLAYNTTDDQYLVVWQGDESDTGPAARKAIFAQRLAGDGALLGGNAKLSQMGVPGDTRFDAQDPAVAYNSRWNEYLVVWRGDDDRGRLVNGEFEIFGQRLDATGAEIGTNDLRISDLGPDGNVAFRAEDAAVAYDSTNDQYLVTWTGNDAGNAGEEIYAQLMASTETVLRNDFRISGVGPDGDPNWDVNEVVGRYDPAQDEFLVAWIGEDDRAGLVVNEREVFAQRLDARTGNEVGPDDFRVTDLGPDGDTRFDVLSVDMAYNTTRGQFLVTWSGDDDRGALTVGDVEIFGQRLDTRFGCVEDDAGLCLSSSRFRVEVDFTTADGQAGAGHAVPLTSDTGYFWFFDPANVELVLKVLDARAVNQRIWVFYGALSNVQYTVNVIDTQTGDFKSYVNPDGVFASVGDTDAFSGALAPAPRVASESAIGSRTTSPAAACRANATTLCLNGGRFQVEVDWQSDVNEQGRGQAETLTGDTGYFWFFDPANVELVLKVLDARSINGKFWVFYGALSNVQYTITVTDTQTGAVKTYVNPSGTFASVGDTEAF